MYTGNVVDFPFRGDIVVARSPHNPTQHICKRVLGLEGDWIDNPPPHYSHRYVSAFSEDAADVLVEVYTSTE